MAASYKELIVYQKAKNLTIEIIKYYYGQRLSFASQTMANQLIRAVSSIGANISEGYGRHYQKNYYQFLSIARGSSFEADYWLDIAQETSQKPNERIKEFIIKNEEIIKMLTSLMKSLEKGDWRSQS